MWAQIINAALGIWLMAAPAVLGYGGAAATNDRIVGPVVATFAVVAWWGATRGTARWNTPLGAWLLLAPWVLGYGPTDAIVNSMVAGGLILGFSFVTGTVDKRYGGGWAALLRDDPEHEREARGAA